MLDTLMAGLIHGNAYALVAVGVSLIFGVTNVVNFAQGSLVALGSMTAWWLVAVAHQPLPVVILGVLVVTGVVGFLIDLAAVRPLAKAPPIAALLSTFAASMILDRLSQLVFEPELRSFPEVLETGNLSVGGVRFGTSDLVMLGLTLVTMLGLGAYLRYGRTGRAIRATAQDTDAAQQMGVPVQRIRSLSFVLASALGGLAGIFVALYTGSTSPTDGATIGLTAFVAATIGGLGSIPGAVLGGFLLGIVEAVGIYTFGDGVRDLITFGLLILVLVLRPAGLLGKTSAVPTEPMTGTFLGAGREIRLSWWHWLIVALGAAVALPLLAPQPALAVANQVLIFAIIAVPMVLLSGSAGQVSLGQAAPVAIGAYTSALTVMELRLPFLVGLVLAGLVAAVTATLLTLPIWRLTGHYVSIATLGIGFVALSIIRNWDAVTRGAYGITGVPAPRIGDLRLTSAGDYYWLNLVVAAIALAVVVRLKGSHLGTVLAAIGSDEVAARSAGVRARDYKVLAYAVAAFFAGIAGALQAHENRYLDPTLFTIAMSTLALTIIVVGGITSPVGAVVGSIVLIAVPELLRLTPDIRILLYGVVLIAVIRFRPQGLWVRRRA